MDEKSKREVQGSSRRCPDRDGESPDGSTKVLAHPPNSECSYGKDEERVPRRDRGEGRRRGFDEASAKKKVEKLLGSRRELGADIEATGDIWTYAAALVSDPRKAAGNTA